MTPEGVVREDSFPLKIDLEDNEDEKEKEPDEPVPLAAGGRHYPVWYYAGKLQQLASQNKVSDRRGFDRIVRSIVGGRNASIFLQ